MAEIEHLWEMPPDPSVGGVISGRYLVVVDGGGVAGAGRYDYAVADTVTGDSDLFSGPIYNSQYPMRITTSPGYVWVLGGFTASSGAVLHRIDAAGNKSVWTLAGTGTYIGTGICYDADRNDLYFVMGVGATRYLRRFDIATGLITETASNIISGAGAVAYDPANNRVLVVAGSTLYRYDANNFASYTTHALTGSSVTAPKQAFWVNGNLVLLESGITQIVVVNPVALAVSSMFFPTSVGSGAQAATGEIYTSSITGSEAYMLDTNLGVSTLTLTNRGGRGCALPISSKTFIPAATR